MKYAITRIEPSPRSAQTPASAAWSGRGWPVSRSSDTRSEARRDLSQGQRVELLALELLGVAGREHPAGGLDADDDPPLDVEADVEGGVRARRVAQQLEVGADALGGGVRRHGLKIDRNLGANDIETGQRTDTAFRPGVRGQNVRRREIRMPGVVGCYRHARARVPEE